MKGDKMKKLLSNILFIICIIGMIIGGIYAIIQTGNVYINMYSRVGLSGMLLYFVIGIIFYGLMFYGIYRLDLKVRRMIKNDGKAK